MRLTDDGLICGDGVRHVASPNCDTRPVDAQIELIVVHNISLPPGEFGGSGIVDLFLNRLQPHGHAGVSSWRGRERCNDFSLGIELEGTDEIPFEDAQYTRLRALIALLRTHYPIADVQGHADVAPGRKTDPGPAFDWLRVK